MNEFYIFYTYAIMEIISGNKSYSPYLNSGVIINNFIFAELCYNLFRDKMINADDILNKYSRDISNINPEWIKEAMQFRIKWKDRKVSVADCVGYIMAKKLGIRFLTGDKEFQNLENVEFVK